MRWTHVRKQLGWERYDTHEAVEAMNDLDGHELRFWLNLFLPSVKLLQKVLVGSKVRRDNEEPRTPFERVQACMEADRERVAPLAELRKHLDPFQLTRTMERKLGRICRLANRRLSPKEVQEVVWSRGPQWGNGCGKAARSASLEIAKRIPLSHSGGDGGQFPVTFQISRHSPLGLHS